MDATILPKRRIYILRPKDTAKTPRLMKSRSQEGVKAQIYREQYFEPEIASAEEAANAVGAGARVEEVL